MRIRGYFSKPKAVREQKIPTVFPPASKTHALQKAENETDSHKCVSVPKDAHASVLHYNMLFVMSAGLWQVLVIGFVSY
jgi:hypothetical protein